MAAGVGRKSSTVRSQVAYAADHDYHLGFGNTKLWTGGNNGWHYFRGRHDQAAIHQRALSAAEVNQHYSPRTG